MLSTRLFYEDAEQKDNKNAPRHLKFVSYCNKKVHGGDARVICPKTDLMRQFTLQGPKDTDILRLRTEASRGKQQPYGSYAWVYSPPGLSDNLLPGTDTVVFEVV